MEKWNGEYGGYKRDQCQNHTCFPRRIEAHTGGFKKAIKQLENTDRKNTYTYIMKRTQMNSSGMF